jgi:hypothetical protein
MKTSAWRESWPAGDQWSLQNPFGVGLKIEESEAWSSDDWKPCLSLQFWKAATPLLSGYPMNGWTTSPQSVALKCCSQCTMDEPGVSREWREDNDGLGQHER